MEKTVIYTTFYDRDESYANLIFEWLISLRTLGNYKGEVIIFDYGISDEVREKLEGFSLGAPTLIKLNFPPLGAGTISNWRNIDVIPHLEKYKGYKFAHFDSDIWFQRDISPLWDELEVVEGCMVGVENGRSCRYRGPKGGEKYNEEVHSKLNGFVFGGWIGGKYQSYLNKLNQMKNLWETTWSTDEWGTDQSMITNIADFSIDNFNGLKYGCSWYYCDIREDGIYDQFGELAFGIHIIAFNMVGVIDKENKFEKYRFKHIHSDLWKNHR
jgi:hypothetical protein